jgi:ferredoxin
MHDDGLAYVKEADWPNLYGPKGSVKGEPVHKMSGGMATVPDQDIDALIEAAEECPGECIFVEVGD